VSGLAASANAAGRRNPHLAAFKSEGLNRVTQGARVEEAEDH